MENNKLKIIINSNYTKTKKKKEIFINQIKTKPNSILGFVTDLLF